MVGGTKKKRGQLTQEDKYMVDTIIFWWDNTEIWNINLEVTTYIQRKEKEGIH